MKNLVIATSAIAVMLTACTSKKQEQQNIQSEKLLNKKLAPEAYVENEVIFSGDTSVVESYFQSKGMTVTISPIVNNAKLVKIESLTAIDIAEVQKDLRGKVDYIEPNYLVELSTYKEKIDMDRWTNDKYFFQQWYLNNIGQKAPYSLPGKRNADINVLKAWEITKGSKNVIVGVIDTGVDYTHPDLKDSMWVNKAEKEGVPGVDDDKNGYTDDIYGYDFVSSGLTSLAPGNVNGTSDPMDHDGHGTHVAGTIAAQTNNAKGVAGVAPNVKIMAIRGLNGNGGAIANLAKAIEYGINAKVDILSNSWGGGGSSELIKEQVIKANRAGILFVAAAGNSSSNNDVKPAYPASYTKTGSKDRIENILSVAASDNQDNPASFSNYGYDTVDVFAPGTMILSTYPVSKSPSPKRAYSLMSGTSMATPVVSGVAALMLSANASLKGRPDLVRKIIIETADQVPSLAGKVIANGRINAYKALTYKVDKKAPPMEWTSQPWSIVERRRHSQLVDIRKKIYVEGARAVQAHFSFIQINEPYDSLYIYDKNQKFIGRMEQSQGLDVMSPIVPGDTMYVRFVNAKLRTIRMALNGKIKSENACSNLGGEYVDGVGGGFTCAMDSMKPMNQGGSEEFVNFNSDGFEIDKVRYLKK